MPRADAAQMAVSARSIVEHFDVVEDIRFGQITCFVDSLFDPFFLQAVEERFGDRVIPTVPAPTHARLQMMFAAEAQPLIAAVLRSLVGVDQCCVGRRRQIAIKMASRTSSLARVGFIDQPTILRA